MKLQKKFLMPFMTLVVLSGMLFFTGCVSAPVVEGVAQGNKVWEKKATGFWYTNYAESYVENFYSLHNKDYVTKKPMLNDGEIIIIDNKGNTIFAKKDVLALNPKTGETRKLDFEANKSDKVKPEDVAEVFPQINMYLTASDDKLTAYKLGTDNELWSVEIEDLWGTGYVIVPSKKLLIFNNAPTGLFASTSKAIFINYQTGKIVKQFEHELELEKKPGGARNKQEAKNKYIFFAYVSKNSKYVYFKSDNIVCIDIDAGKQVWENDDIYFTMGTGGLAMAANAMNSSGYGNGQDMKVSISGAAPIDLGNGTILVEDVKDNLYCLDKKTGEEKWKEDVYEDNTIFMVGDEIWDYAFHKGIRVLDKNTGKELREFDDFKKMIITYKISDKLYLVDAKGNFIVLNKDTFAEESKTNFTDKLKSKFKAVQFLNDSKMLILSGNFLILYDYKTNVTIKKIDLKYSYTTFANLSNEFNGENLLINCFRLSWGMLYSINMKNGQINYIQPNRGGVRVYDKMNRFILPGGSARITDLKGYKIDVEGE